MREYDADADMDATRCAAALAMPGSQLADDFVTYTDDFLTGAVDASGLAIEPFGELGWATTHAAGTSRGLYTSELDHPGILAISCLENSWRSIALPCDHFKFARNGRYRAEVIFRVDDRAGSQSDFTIAYGDVIIVQVNQSGTVLIDGLATGKTVANSDWIRASLWCAGDGTAHWDVRWGCEVISGSKAVTTTTINQSISLQWYAASGATITSHVDLFKLLLPRHKRRRAR